MFGSLSTTNRFVGSLARTDQVRSIQGALQSGSSTKVIAELVDDLGTRTRVLQSMRSDLDVLHRRLKYVAWV